MSEMVVTTEAILACGYMRHGKDTLIGFIREYLSQVGDSRYQDAAFADPIKNIVNTLFGWSKAELEEGSKDNKITCSISIDNFDSAEDIYCYYGFENHESYSLGPVIEFGSYVSSICSFMGLTPPDYSGKIISSGMVYPREAYQYTGDEFGRLSVDVDVWCKLTKKPDFALFTDLRRVSEAGFTKKHYEKTTIIKVFNPNKPLPPEEDRHGSEIEIDNIQHDYYLVNDGGLSELKEKVFALMRTLV